MKIEFKQKIYFCQAMEKYEIVAAKFWLIPRIKIYFQKSSVNNNLSWVPVHKEFLKPAPQFSIMWFLDCQFLWAIVLGILSLNLSLGHLNLVLKHNQCLPSLMKPVGSTQRPTFQSGHCMRKYLRYQDEGGRKFLLLVAFYLIGKQTLS